MNLLLKTCSKKKTLEFQVIPTWYLDKRRDDTIGRAVKLGISRKLFVVLGNNRQTSILDKIVSSLLFKRY